MKQADAGADAGATEQNRIGLLNDWAGLQLLGRVAPDGPWPSFLGGDAQAGLLVMQDLGDAPQLDHILLGDDPSTARDALVSYTQSLALLHAATAGSVERYSRSRKRLGAERDLQPSQALIRLREVFGRVHLTTAALDRELERLAAVLDDPGPFLVYTHGDACPDNCLVVDGRVRLVDFEWGGVRHALFDGAFVWIHFPTCWCVNRLPDDLPAKLLATYRDALSERIPAATDDRAFGAGLVAASAASLVGLFPMDPFAEDFRWGISSIRQRWRMRVDLLVQVCERFGYPALEQASTLLARHLHHQWSDLAPMPVYPAFC